MSGRKRGRPALLCAVRAEWAKLSHGGARKVALAAPLPFCALGFLASGALGGGGAGGAGFATYGWNYWYVLMLPIAVALMTASVANLDARLGLRGVLGLPIDPALTWWGKVAASLALVFAANLVIWAASCASFALGGTAPGPMRGLVAAVLLTVSVLWMVPAGLALTLRAGTLVGIAAPALVQVAVGLVLAHSRLWWLAPMAAVLRLPAPILGVAPSGIPLLADDPLWVIDGPWWAALVISVLVAGVLAAAGARWFRGREAL